MTTQNPGHLVIALTSVWCIGIGIYMVHIRIEISLRVVKALLFMKYVTVNINPSFARIV